LSGAGRAWIDGASRGNPGEAGFGVLLETDGQEEEILGYLGRATNNVAEYAGLLAALTRAASTGLAKLTVISDSQLLVRQMEGSYRVKAQHLLPYFLAALKLRRAIPPSASATCCGERTRAPTASPTAPSTSGPRCPGGSACRPEAARMEVARRLAAVRERIEAACRRAGRRPEEVTLLGASKTQPAAAIEAAFRAGLKTFGENRVQEARAKAALLPAEIEWHLIGPLQSNKARPAVDLFAAVHSLDRPAIGEALDREAARRGRVLPCFAEVNLAGEETKHGFRSDGLAASLAPFAGLAHLSVVGLMAIPPFEDDPEASRPWFRRLAGLAREVAAAGVLPGFASRLSMGMSADFEVAIEEGATHVRVGTALFGPREG
jgi:pyridoxal phosphate enzyme (YggS family)